MRLWRSGLSENCYNRKHLMLHSHDIFRNKVNDWHMLISMLTFLSIFHPTNLSKFSQSNRHCQTISITHFPLSKFESWNLCWLIYEEFEYTKGVRIRIWKKNRQHNCQRKKDKERSTKHTHKTKDRVTRTSLTIGVELICSGRVSSSCFTSDTPC